MSETILQISERMWGDPETTPELVARRRKQYADFMESAKNRVHEVSEEDKEKSKKAREAFEDDVRNGKYELTEDGWLFLEKLCEVIRDRDKDTLWKLRGYRLMDEADLDAEFNKLTSMPQEELAAYLAIDLIRRGSVTAKLR